MQVKKSFSLFRRVKQGQMLTDDKPLFSIDNENIVELATILIDDEITEIKAIDRTVPIMPIFHFESYGNTFLICISNDTLQVMLVKDNGHKVVCETALPLLELAYKYLVRKGYDVSVSILKNIN
jgi:hypothetical protein